MVTIDSVRPMLLDERKVAPKNQRDYVVELKLDGYRVLGLFGEGVCELRTRNGADCTRWFEEVSNALKQLKCGRMIVDGEMSVLDQFGRSDFNALHARARRRKHVEGEPCVTYCIFDLLVENGLDITREPLIERKARLAAVLKRTQPDHTLYVQHFTADDVESPISWLYKQALELHLEGVVAKLANSAYEPGIRTPYWFKLKRPGAVPPERFKR